MKKFFVVIGLGKFGSSFARTLVEHDMEVLAIDMNEERVNSITEHVTHALIMNALDEGALRNAGVREADAVVVSIGSNIEANILVVTLLKKLGVENIIAKAVNELHGMVLENLGVRRIVYPERDMAQRVANSIARTDILESIELSNEYSIVEILAPPFLWDKMIMETNLRAEFSLNIIAIVSEGGEEGKRSWLINPSPSAVIREGNFIVTLGSNENIKKFRSTFKV